MNISKSESGNGEGTPRSIDFRRELYLSDEEFDDTRIETPKILRNELLNNSYSTSNSDAINATPDKPYVFRKSTTLIPLKDHGSNIKESSRAKHPFAYRYRSRNGTPLRKPPIKLDNNHGNFTADTAKSDTKLISPNNKLNPGQLQPTNLALMQEIQYSSPTRNGSYKRQTFSSSPASLKMKPLSFPALPDEDQKQISNGFQRILIKSVVTDVNDKDSQTAPEKSKGSQSQWVSKNLDVSTRSSPIKLHENGLLRDLRSFEWPPENDDVSRANLLEKVNQTLDSINGDLKRTYSPAEAARISHTRTQDKLDLGLASESGNESEEIIDKLEFNHNRQMQMLDISTPLNGGTGRVSESGHSHEHDILSPRVTNIPPGERINVEVGGQNVSAVNIYPEVKNSEMQVESKLWLAEKWSKLNRLLRLNSLTRYDLINSRIVLSELGCKNKAELIRRIDFLQALNLAQKHKVKETGQRRVRSHGKNRNLKNGRVSRHKLL